MGIVQKVLQARILVCITDPLQCYMNSECVLESRDTPIAGNNIRPFAMFMCRLCIHVIQVYIDFLCFGQSLIDSLWRGKDGWCLYRVSRIERHAIVFCIYIYK